MALFHTTVLDNQIKALPTVDTASGAIATFNTDLTENLVEVKCQIVAKQASGTPTPDNPLPILTFDDLTLYHNDINLWNEEWELGTYDSSGQPAPSNTIIRSKTRIMCKPNTTYYFKGGANNENSIKYFYDINDNYLSNYGGTGSGAFTTPNNCAYMRFRMSSDYGTTYNHDISINYPSTDTQYHAFNGAYIQFSQTVANGVLDINSGKLRVTDGYRVFDGTENWSVYATYNYHYQITLPNVLSNDNQSDEVINSYSSHFTGRPRFASNNSSITEGVFSADGSRIRFKNVDCADLTEWKSFITTQYNNGTPVQVVYKLATPIEIQLDSITLTALLNENNIWCDTGDTEVKFLLTVGKKIS